LPPADTMAPAWRERLRTTRVQTLVAAAAAELPSNSARGHLERCPCGV